MVNVNDTQVYLKGKNVYTFVDIFDFYPFDLKTPGGTELVMTLNGERAQFTAELNQGDNIQIYWR